MFYNHLTVFYKKNKVFLSMKNRRLHRLSRYSAHVSVMYICRKKKVYLYILLTLPGCLHHIHSNNLLSSLSSIYSLHPPISSMNPAEVYPLTVPKSSSGTQALRKQTLPDTEGCQNGGRLPAISNMKRSRSDDPDPLGNKNNNYIMDLQQQSLSLPSLQLQVLLILCLTHWVLRIL